MGVVKDAKIARKCAKKLLAKLGREPTQAEIAKAVEKKKAKKGKAAPDAAAHGDATPTAAAPPPASASGAAYLAEHAVACTRDGAPARPSSRRRAVAWPAACGGGDVVALAKAAARRSAYLLPAFRGAAAPAGSLAVVVLAPTRELAIQIGADAAAWGRMETVVVYGADGGAAAGAPGEAAVLRPAAIGQSFFKLDDSEKDEQLAKLIDGMADSDRMICFTNTKRRVDYLAVALGRGGASAIHGGRSQAEREEALRKFKTNEWPLMFATDVAARGLDLPDVSVVVNFDMPRDVEQYVHRIGRTGRAGKSGRSVTFWNPAYDTECAGALAKIARGGPAVPDWRVPPRARRAGRAV
ncbi:helicase [Aureococcus anophagefferens]|nr:helicase [Aureococcus anophagefferens]